MYTVRLSHLSALIAVGSALSFAAPSQAGAHDVHGTAATPADLGAQALSVCAPAWIPTFGGEPGVTGTVHALAAFDDGSGEATYVGGAFTSAGGDDEIVGIGRWDGSAWSPVGSDLFGQVFALTVHDDGSGPALYAGGSLNQGSETGGLFRWNGKAWSEFGGGIGGGVRALAVDASGSQPLLYAGGQFTQAGGGSAQRVAVWDGTSWSPLGQGMNFTVEALAVYDSGAGPELFAGGSFTQADNGPAMHIARWDGSSWSPVTSGTNDPVRSLAVFDAGGGPRLFVGGQFTQAGGVGASRIATWNGAQWSPVGSGLGNEVYALTVHDDGAGPALFAGGDFASRVRKLVGSSWLPLSGSGIGGLTVRALGTGGGAQQDALFVGGDFDLAGDAQANSVAFWSDGSYSGLVETPGSFDAPVDSLLVVEPGGPVLVAGGQFQSIGGVPAEHVAAWDGETWSAIGEGLSGGTVAALTTFDTGSGALLHAAGQFSNSGANPVQNVARWNGSTWEPLGGGLSSLALAMAVFDDGGGEALFVGGAFQFADGAPASRIAKWDGSSWSPLGAGVTSGFSSPSIHALAVHDDGSGEALYAAGSFQSVDGVAAANVARWDGSTWTPVGGGLNSLVRALTVHDDGSGPALYAGGSFNLASGAPVNYVAKWDGQAWSALDGGLAVTVQTLHSHDDGSGAKLIAGGSFSSDFPRIAAWDGTSWSALGGGMSNPVHTLASWPTSYGSALLAGGGFGSALDSNDSYLALWGCDASLPLVYCTPKTSSAGCSAAIGTSDLASQPQSGASDYAVTAVDVQGQKAGLLFAGFSSSAALPFNGGTLCAAPPLKRGPIQFSGGTAPGSCDGSFSTIVNDGAVAPLGLDAGPGQPAWYQYWYRDPQGGSGALGTALSNAVQLEFQ